MGAISSAVFAVRNTDKTLHGDIGRSPVPIVQVYNSIYDIAKVKAGAISDGANALLNKVDTVGKAAGVSNAATKISSVASKAVNPLLCVASGVRVLKDDDQYSALIEEGCAMGAMFGAERGFKHLRKATSEAIEKGNIDNLIKNDKVRTFGSELIQNINKMSKGKKTALFVAAELLFVVASVCAFDVGKKVGKTITGRQDNKNPFSEKKTS